jgi:AraC-like DNA-binding protein
MQRRLIGLIGIDDPVVLAALRTAFADDPQVQLLHRTSFGYGNLPDWRSFSGVVMHARTATDRMFMEQCQRPAVAILDHQEEAWPQVRIDDEAIGRAAAHSLREAGCERLFGFGVNRHPWSRNRLAGFAAVAGKAGALLTDPQRIGDPYGPHAKQVRQCFRECFTGISVPVGLFGVDRGMVLNLLHLLEEAPPGLPPVEVAGVHEKADVECSENRVHKIQRPLAQVGRVAALMLRGLLATGNLEQPSIIIRDVDVLAPVHLRGTQVEDPIIRRALAVCYQYYTNQLSVDDLAQMAGVQRRTLERACRVHLNRTPLQVLQAIRIDFACEHLKNSTMAIRAIAAAVGFGSEDRFAACFRRQMGMTASAYRAQHHDQPTETTR